MIIIIETKKGMMSTRNTSRLKNNYRNMILLMDPSGNPATFQWYCLLSTLHLLRIKPAAG